MMQPSCSPCPCNFITPEIITGCSSGAVKIYNRQTPPHSTHLLLRLNLLKIKIPSVDKVSIRLCNTIITSCDTTRLCNLIRSRQINISRGFLYWIISLYFVCLCLVAQAHDDQFSPVYYACEDVQSYYAGVEHMSGEELKKNLNIIISKHQSLPYKQVWDAIKILDAANVNEPEASSQVVEIYSLRNVLKSLAGKPNGWNREHLWPRSYGLTTHQSLTDLHNIRAVDRNVNSSRGNKYYGECIPDRSYCLKPATKEAAPDTETDKKSWAPPLQVRGDIARALMYMAVCYGFPQSDGGVNLRLSDFPRAAKNEMGLLTTLLKWNDLDPPSKEEKLRNERVCKLYQHNRNPFVDHPEYVSLIWEQVPPSQKSLRANKYGSGNSVTSFEQGKELIIVDDTRTIKRD